MFKKIPCSDWQLPIDTPDNGKTSNSQKMDAETTCVFVAGENQTAISGFLQQAITGPTKNMQKWPEKR